MATVDRAGSRTRPKSSLEGVGELLRAAVAFAPRRAAGVVALLLVAGVTEAFGILMLVPLLYAIGIGGEVGEQDATATRIAAAAETVGLTLDLGNVLLLFLGAVVLRAAVAWWREVLIAKMRFGFVDGLRVDLYTAMSRAKWEHLLGWRQSNIQHTVNADVNRTGSAMLMFLSLPVRGVLAVAQLGLALAIAPLISAIALSLGAVAVFASRVLVRRSRQLGERMTRYNRRLFGSTTDFLAGLRLAKAYGVERRHVDEFVDTTTAMRAQQLTFTRLNSLAGAATNVGGAATVVVMIWVGASQASLTTAELAVIVVIFARLLPLLMGFLRSAQQLANALPAYQNVVAMSRAFIAAAEPEAPAAAAEARESATPLALERTLTLRGVCFAYGGGEPVLEDVDLDIRAGTVTAVGGPSGAGKSTLAELLLGLLTPVPKGVVLVDGVPLTGERRRRWHQSVAYVPQDPYLFHDTIRGNLLWARPGASESDIHDALCAAAADRFVARLPEGIDTVVGDRGSRLSGGERQRVALARALLRRPALLVLDEATGQLDAETEQQVAAMLRRLLRRTTVVAIAHQAAVFAVADRAVRIEGGQLREGRPTALEAPLGRAAATTAARE